MSHEAESIKSTSTFAGILRRHNLIREMASFTATFAPALPAKLCGAGSRSLKASSRAAVRVSAKGDGARVDRFSKDSIMCVILSFLFALVATIQACSTWAQIPY